MSLPAGPTEAICLRFAKTSAERTRLDDGRLRLELPTRPDGPPGQCSPLPACRRWCHA